MQSLDVISVNLWQIVVSLANLVILFLLIKKFLYKPVKKMLEARQGTIDKQYADAESAKTAAEQDRLEYAEKLRSAKVEAEGVIQSAVSTANAREQEIVSIAKEKAEGILRKAESDAELERRKAREGIRQEIIEVSTLLAEKILEREVNSDDHTELINTFLDNIGDGNEQ